VIAPHEDYYAVLQVQPDAEPEVIEAAYRQLMRKYHPDVAGTDRERAAILHDRAKGINRAYAVLRDPRQRSIYDQLPTRSGGSAPPPWRPSHAPSEASRPSASVRPGSDDTVRPAGSGVGARTRPASVPPGPMSRAVQGGPWSQLLGTISSLYYFLPGPYEWERERDKDLLAAWIMPPLGVASWSLASGRLNWLTDHAPYAAVFAWALLALLALPLWSTLPRLLLASAPTALLLMGQVEGLLHLAGVPVAVAWIGASVLGILFSARLYVFVVLPTLVVCWLLVNASLGLAAFGSVLAEVDASLSIGQLGVLTLACLLGVLTWLTVMSWGRPSIPAQAKPASAQSQPQAAVIDRNKPLFRRISADRVRAIQTVPLRTHRDCGEPPSTVVAAQQEANILLVQDSWAFLQTDDGREGWAEWSLAS
jgi:hypothetical protein